MIVDYFTDEDLDEVKHLLRPEMNERRWLVKAAPGGGWIVLAEGPEPEQVRYIAHALYRSLADAVVKRHGSKEA